MSTTCGEADVTDRHHRYSLNTDERKQNSMGTMTTVVYQTADTPTLEELMTLYDAVGWSAYTKDPPRLTAAISASLSVITARDDGELIGLARLVGDGLTIVYLQDILVSPQHQRRGVGRALFQQIFAPYDDVRQKVLITDNDHSQKAFYESMAFTEASDLQHPIRAFVQLR